MLRFYSWWVGCYEKDICYQFGKISTLRLENTVFFIRMIFFSIKSTCHKKY